VSRVFKAIQIQHDNILYDLTSSFRFDGHGKNELTRILNEIREEYKIKDRDMREELHRKCRCHCLIYHRYSCFVCYLDLYECNQHIKKNLDQNLLEANREDLERRQLVNELHSLNDNRVLLRQKLELIQEHCKNTEINVERELKRKQQVQQIYDEQVEQLNRSIREYVRICVHFVEFVSNFI
jgi:hypothetical protein